MRAMASHQPHHCLLNRLFRRRSKKHQSSASLAFVGGIHRWPVNSPHKGPVTRKMFPFDDVIIGSLCHQNEEYVARLPSICHSMYSNQNKKTSKFRVTGLCQGSHKNLRKKFHDFSNCMTSPGQNPNFQTKNINICFCSPCINLQNQDRHRHTLTHRHTYDLIHPNRLFNWFY